jgi:hypothetical protein
MAAPALSLVRAEWPLVAAAIAVAATTTFVDPATALSSGLYVIVLMLAVRLDLPRVIAIAWALAVLPIYLDFPGASLPLDLPFAAVLFTRTFVVGRRRFSFGGWLQWGLVLVIVSAAAISAYYSPNRSLSTYYLTRFVVWLLYIPAARAIYTDWRTIAPSLTALLLAVGAQVIIGLAQLAFDIPFALGVLSSPVTPALMPRGSVMGKLATQDFNWIMNGHALPSGLFINSIVYAICISTVGMIFLAAPARWLPGGRAGLWRAMGALAILVALVCFKLTAWIGIVAGVATLVLLRLTDRRRRIQVLIVPALAAGVLWLTLHDLIQRRLEDIASGSLITRIYTWTQYWTNLEHSGRLGVGLSQANTLAPSVPTIAGGEAHMLELAPENSFIGLSAEIGVPAAIAFHLLLLGLVIRRRGGSVSWALPALVTTLVGNLGVYGLTDDHIMPLVTLLAGLASSEGGRQT